MPKASKGRVVVRAMTFVVTPRRIALLHHVELRIAVEQAFALTIVAVRAFAAFVVRLADARLAFLDAVRRPNALASIAGFFGGRARRRIVRRALRRAPNRRRIARAGL